MKQMTKKEVRKQNEFVTRFIESFGNQDLSQISDDFEGIAQY